MGILIKDNEERQKQEDKIRRERYICDLISEDPILDKIHTALGLIEENGIGTVNVSGLKKAYNDLSKFYYTAILHTMRI